MCTNVRALTVLDDLDTNRRPHPLYTPTQRLLSSSASYFFSISGRENVTNAPAVLHITNTTSDHSPKYLRISHKTVILRLHSTVYQKVYIS